MLGPKSDNQITDGDGNAQVGHNSGTINVGLTFAEHKEELERRLAEKTVDLERAHDAEKQVLASEVASLSEKLNNLDTDYKERIEELAEVKERLARYDNQLDAEKRNDAFAAIDRGDTTLAQALFKELALKARAKREDATTEEAVLEFELGKIAEDEVRWLDAADHYARAARLEPGYDTLLKAGEFLGRAGRHEEAIQNEVQLLKLARDIFGNTHEKTATALNNLAGSFRSAGRYDEAEPLYREALEIGRKTIGEAHPAYAIRLNNLAGLLEATGRYAEAEPLYRKALEITRKTIGEAHPSYAIRLNNLAGLLQATGRFAEAEPLYREALKIDRKTLGAAHPDYAIDLNNLAGLLEATGRYAEAERLYREALEIDSKTIGEAHPSYATRLNNLAGLLRATGRDAEAEPLYHEALAVLEAALGADHPNTKTTAENLETFLATRP